MKVLRGGVITTSIPIHVRSATRYIIQVSRDWSRPIASIVITEEEEYQAEDLVKRQVLKAAAVLGEEDGEVTSAIRSVRVEESFWNFNVALSTYFQK